jgi:hypothetical protein
MEAEKCVICGRTITEGTQVCPDCMTIKDQEQQGTARELRDIEDVLSITENTDGNMQKSMEALLRIASRLERKKK